MFSSSAADKLNDFHMIAVGDRRGVPIGAAYDPVIYFQRRAFFHYSKGLKQCTRIGDGRNLARFTVDFQRYFTHTVIMTWFYCPTQVCLGSYALKNNADALGKLGRRCLVVTGKTSAAVSGVLDDLAAILHSLGITYEIFDEVEPNPSIHACLQGGRRARVFGAEFIIGAGGGSPLDAAKAVAAYAVNDIEPIAIFDSPPIPPLPVAAIPTTAGTGSEVNGYAVLTIPEQGAKRTYSSPRAFPVVAFLDPRYTASLPYDQTVSTALDAFCHCAESYFSPSHADDQGAWRKGRKPGLARAVGGASRGYWRIGQD